MPEPFRLAPIISDTIENCESHPKTKIFCTFVCQTLKARVEFEIKVCVKNKKVIITKANLPNSKIRKRLTF